ncbi:unnamed protein product [Effrenium voratum]|nr:unnamed protein product [Effrenium voratum]
MAQRWREGSRALEAALKLRKGGKEQIQVIMDFDHTMTCFRRMDGTNMPQSHCSIEHLSLMPDAFREGYGQLWEEQKRELAAGIWPWEMWWKRSHELMVEHGFRREWVEVAVKESGMHCRQRTLEFLKLVQANGIPVLVVSAGLREVIVEVLRQSDIDMSLVQIFANEMVFDEKGALASVSHAVTPDSKRDTGIMHAAYFEEVKRKHAVVMGDNLADCSVIEKVPGIDAFLRVGFYNIARGKWEEFEECFDLLLSNEELAATECLDMGPVIDLFHALLGMDTESHDPFLARISTSA